jgi:hypothetical protein
VRTPLSARLGIYLLLAGLTFDLILHYAGGVEYLVPEISCFSILLFPSGLILLAGTAIFQLIALRRERAERISLTSPGPKSGELQIGHGPNQLEARVGLGLTLLGIASFICIQSWMATRTFTAVDMLVSLAPGRIQTGPFHINVKGGYQVWLGSDEYVPIDPQCVSYNLFKARWDLHHNGQVVASWDEGFVNTYMGGFDSEKGIYDLDLQVLSDGSCLSPRHPKLRIYTNKSEYEDSTTPVLWFSLLSTSAGTSLLAFFALGYYENRSLAITNITESESISPHFQWAQKLRLKPAISGLPSFGLVCALFLSWLIMLHIVFYQEWRYHSNGVMVSVMQHVPPAQDSDRWVEPLVLRLQGARPGLPSSLFLNSRQLSWEELNSGLKAELSRRSVWVVYIGVDSNLPWQDALSAIDAARAVHAKAVLLTVKTKPKVRLTAH